MRSTNGLRVIAIAAAAAAMGAPAAYAVPIQGGGSGGGAIVQTAPVSAQHDPNGSTDWALVAGGTAGGLGILAAGLAAGRRVRRVRIAE